MNWTLIIAILAVVLNIANSWALKSYEFKNSKKEPKAELPTTSKKRLARKRYFLTYYNLTNLVCCILAIDSTIHFIRYPTKYPNFDSLIISSNVVMVVINLRRMFFDPLKEKMADRIFDTTTKSIIILANGHTSFIQSLKEHSDILKTAIETDKLLITQTERLQKQIDAINAAHQTPKTEQEKD